MALPLRGIFPKIFGFPKSHRVATNKVNHHQIILGQQYEVDNLEAKLLLRLYKAGKKDFSGENLRGLSFKGQDLSGADFKHADIRGTDFTSANLAGANLSFAKAGLQYPSVFVLLMASLFLATLSGYAASISVGYVGVGFLGEVDKINFINVYGKATEGLVFGVSGLVSFCAFWAITIRQSLKTALIGIAVVIIAALVVSGVLFRASALGVEGTQAIARLVGTAVAGVITMTWAIAASATLAVAMALAKLIAGGWAMFGIGTSSFAWLLAGTGTGWPAAWVVAGILYLPVLGVGVYITQLTFLGNPQLDFICSIAITLASIGGTHFRGADLTDANFAQATLKSTDLRNTTTTRTNWHQAKKLDCARVGGTTLLNPDVRDLLVTHRGTKKSYVGLTLEGANLLGADLSDADLTGADVSEATFEEAWLERANLTKIQAINTNFYRAKLTGACLEAWNIDSRTQLEGAICDFVFLLNQQRERRPNSGNFAPGEFSKLFEEVLDTIDLIFRNGVDWKAFVYSFKQVQVENEDTELTVQSIENKGDGVVVVKVQASPNADKEKIHSDFTRNYELALKAVEDRYKTELNAKENEIKIYRQQSADMMEIVKLQASKPINVDVKASADSKAMQESSDQSRKIEIGNVGRDFNASGSALNLGDIGGTVTNNINQLANSPQPDQPGIKELLTQLHEVIATETTLTDDDKAEALEQVKALAKAGQNPSDGTMQKLAKRANRILRGIIEEVPTAAKLAESCSKLLPAISSILGL